MAIPTVSALPPAPSRVDQPATFVVLADAFVAALPNLGSEINAVVAAIPDVVVATNYNTTSTSSVTIGTGLKTFAAGIGSLLRIGMFVIAASAANPANFMTGQVNSYDSATGALQIQVGGTGGSGTFADWVIGPTVSDTLEPLAAIAASGSGADLAEGSVTLSKVQSVTAARLLGRYTASTGVIEQISLGAGLSLSNAGVLTVSTGTATLADGDYGDVVVSGTGTILTVDAGSITFAKMQDVNTDILLGRSAAGVGDVMEIACTAAGRALLDDATAAAQRTTLGLGGAALLGEATAAEYRANVADKALSTDQVWLAAAYVALAQAATIAVDLNAGFNFTTTMTGNRTLGNPSNAKPGQAGCIEILQDATGSRTLAFSANWKFAGGTDPVLTTTAGARDLLFYQVLSATVIYASLVKGVA